MEELYHITHSSYVILSALIITRITDIISSLCPEPNYGLFWRVLDAPPCIEWYPHT